MNAERLMRASDQDRETTVTVLRDAYAVGRLTPEEFYQRVDAAYTAMTWGELDLLTTDLPVVGTDVNPPSDIAASRGRSRTAGQSLFRQVIWVHVIWMFLLVLAAGLAGRVTAAAVWAACALVPLVLLVPLALERVSGALRCGPPASRGGRCNLPRSPGAAWRPRSMS